MNRLYRLGCSCILAAVSLSFACCTQARVAQGHEHVAEVDHSELATDAAVGDAQISASLLAADPTAGGSAAASSDADADAAVAAASAPEIDALPRPRCRLDAGGPYTVLEGEDLTLTVRCRGGLARRRSLELDPIPAGARYERGTLSWRPALDQAGHYELTVHEPISDERGTLIIDVIDRFDAPDNQPVDPLHYLEEYGLPVLHLVTERGLNDEEYTPARVVYRGHAYEGAEIKLRGATSLSYPKNSYTLKFTKADKFNEPSFAGGFVNKRKVALTTTFDDNSYLRQRLGYELWNRLDASHIRVQAYNAVLFLNGSYFGLYTVTDHVDGYLMEDFGHSQDGDLYKGRSANANFRANLNGSQTLKQTLHEGYSKEEGVPEEGEEGAFDNLDGFVRWVVDTAPDQLAAEADSHIALQEYVDWWVFVSFIAADDSISKNSYHYRDPLLAGSVWHYIPWDLNHSFGQDWNTGRQAPMLTRPEGLYRRQNNLFEKLLASSEATAMRQRYARALATEAFSVERIIELYDQLVAEVDASAKRDEQKWGEKYRGFGHWNKRTDFTSYEEEVTYMRQWIRDRHAYVQSLYPVDAAAP